jgi:hypothetical protein
VVQVDPLEEVRHGALVLGALLGLDGLRGVGLSLDLVDEGDDLPERVVAILRPFHLHEPQDVGVVDHEDGLEVGHLGPEEHVEDPFPRAHGPVLVAEALLPPDHEQGVARGRVERLQAAALEHREAGEPVDVEPADLTGGPHHGERADQREATGDPRCVLADLLHDHASFADWTSRAASRFRDDFLMLTVKWMMSPTATSTHETYGMSQPGFSTTWRIESMSPLPKLAW